MLGRAFDGALTPMIQFAVEDEGLWAEEIKTLRGLLDRASTTRLTSTLYDRGQNRCEKH